MNGKDQFSDKDLPSPPLSVANNRTGSLAVHSSVKATSADLHITSFQTQSLRMWHGESKNGERFFFLAYWFRLNISIYGFSVITDQIYVTSSLSIKKIRLRKQGH